MTSRAWFGVDPRNGKDRHLDNHGCDPQRLLNPLTSSPDRGKLLAAIRLVDPSVTREQLDDWLETEREQTLTKVYYNPRGFGSIDRTFRDARLI